MKNISMVCERLYSKLLTEIPQFENDELLWILNGSVLCNILANVEFINNEYVDRDLKELFTKFTRNPKGDIDISYKADRPYKFDLTSKEVQDFYSISEEHRTYNFVDSNSILNDSDIEELCRYQTANGLDFYAKKPQYLFLYKFKEFVAIFHNELLINDLDSILQKKKNIIRDTSILYEISCKYFGYENTNNLLIQKLKDISGFFHELYEKNQEEYIKMIKTTLKVIIPMDIKKLN